MAEKADSPLTAPAKVDAVPTRAGDGPELVPQNRTPEALRALEEAEARRKASASANAPPASVKEVGGASGPDPVRYGDWEKGGIASDF
jgi:hypothetical protein